MQIRMRNAESLTHSQINEFLKGSAGIEFSGQSRVEVYGWVEEMLRPLEISGAPLDFVSTHTYGNAPLDWRPSSRRPSRNS